MYHKISPKICDFQVLKAFYFFNVLIHKSVTQSAAIVFDFLRLLHGFGARPLHVYAEN